MELGGEGGQVKGRGWKGVFLDWGHQVWEPPREARCKGMKARGGARP